MTSCLGTSAMCHCLLLATPVWSLDEEILWDESGWTCVLYVEHSVKYAGKGIPMIFLRWAQVIQIHILVCVILNMGQDGLSMSELAFLLREVTLQESTISLQRTLRAQQRKCKEKLPPGQWSHLSVWCGPFAGKWLDTIRKPLQA